MGVVAPGDKKKYFMDISQFIINLNVKFLYLLCKLRTDCD